MKKNIKALEKSLTKAIEKNVLKKSFTQKSLLSLNLKDVSN